MSNGIEPFYISGWDPMVSSNQDGNFPVNSSMAPQNAAVIPHFPALLENQNMGMGVLKTSDMMMMIDEERKSGLHQILSQNLETKGASSSCPNSENGGLFGVSPPNAKGKRKVEQEPRISSTEIVDDNNNEYDPNFNSNSRGKQQFHAVKQANDTVIGAENPKENYVHVRAKRGQATNSHSLAERVRREKISERMKLLQDLVPGCNKITGKAVMLDEIINYVQSLQQQVEFLSMKLATVNPEINLDLDRILPNEILHPQANEASIIGAGPGFSYPQSFHGHHPQVPMSGFIATNPTFHHIPLSSWNSDLQSILQPGFGSNQSVNSSEPSGPS